MNVHITRIDKTLPLPQYQTSGSFAFDFIAREPINIAPKSIALIPSNVIIQCPDNLALLVLPRSSMPRKKHLRFPHSIGLIDQDYCGPQDEIMIQVENMSDENVSVDRGERIAQGLFVKTETIQFVESDETTQTSSRGGFGSTGTHHE